MDALGEWLPSQSERASNLSSQNPNEPVVVDFGSSFTRIGLGSQEQPAHELLTRSARYRDRKTGEQHNIAGNNVLLEPSARNQVRSPFDGPLLTNWESAEAVLDHSLGLIGYEAGGTAPIAISEALLAPHLPHRTMQELLFEGYDTPKVAFGADVLAQCCLHVPPSPSSTSSEGSDRGSMLLISVGSEATHVVPVLNGKPNLEYTRRINFGARYAAEFLHELLVLKYPNFPTPVTRGEVEQLLQKHCVVAEDYRATVQQMMDIGFLTEFERRIQAPVPQQQQEATEEAERVKQEQQQRRQESGRRLQEQTAIMRVERQERQQQELQQLQQFQQQLLEMETEVALEHAQHAGFTDLVDLKRTIKQLNNSLRRSRGETIEDPEPHTPLLDVPDAELNAEDLKEKRRQRLLRASYDARQRQKAEKEAQRQLKLEEEQRDADWRTRDLSGWCASKRAELMEVLEVIREREKLRNNPRLRFQQTLMATSASMGANGASGGGGSAGGSAGGASGGSANGGSTGGAGGSSANGANDDEDWDLEEEEEEERDYDGEASALQMLLLEHDPTFDPSQLEPQIDWKDSTVHKFLWGAHPYDPENVEQQYQLNLNIERVRALEPLFQPQIVGVDQAGLSETVVDILKRFPQLVQHIQISGGGANFQGLAKRLETDLRRELPVDFNIDVVVGSQPQLDSWRGLAKWSKNTDAYVSRAEYNENGADYVKEHLWGNPYH